MSSARIILTGKLSADAEAKTSAAGKAYCRLAVSLKHVDQQKAEHWVWYNVTVFGRDADTAALRKKGAGVTIVGRQTPKLGTGKDGTPKVSVDVIADSVDWHEWLPTVTAGGTLLEPTRPAQPSDEAIDDIPF